MNVIFQKHIEDKKPMIVSFDTLINRIKSGHYTTDVQISVARSLYKREGKTEHYKSFRRNVIPGVCWGIKSLYSNTSRRASNINDVTGFMYIDADNISKEELLSLEGGRFIKYLWLSLSETGIGGILEVEGLNKDNYKETYKYINETYFDNKLDESTCDITRINYLSKDINMYSNLDNELIKVQFVSNIQNNPSSLIPPITPLQLTPNCTFIQTNRFRLNNADEHFTGSTEVLSYYKDGVDTVTSFIPKFVRKGSRRKVLLAYFTNFFALNPHLFTLERLLVMYDNIKNRFEGSVEENKLIGIFKTIESQFKTGELKVNYNKKRKVIFNPMIKDKETKIAAMNQKLGEEKVAKTISKIDEFFGDEICNINKKVTYDDIVKFTGISLRTIKTRITEEQKQIIKEHNNNLKNGGK